jgi:hypothetical protein
MSTRRGLDATGKQPERYRSIDRYREIGTGGGKLTMLYDRDVLLLCGANANGHYWQQFMAGEFSRRRLVALSADGKGVLWHVTRHRPIIVGQRDRQPGPSDLTGRANAAFAATDRAWSIMRTGHHCGMISVASCSSSAAIHRFATSRRTSACSAAGHRSAAGSTPPANGLVMIPEGCGVRLPVLH